MVLISLSCPCCQESQWKELLVSLHTLPIPEPGVSVHLGVVSESQLIHWLKVLLTAPQKVQGQLKYSLLSSSVHLQHYFFTVPDTQELPSIPENVSCC